MIKSADELIGALGGTVATAAIAGVGKSAVSNWRTSGRIPAEYFLSISQRCPDEIDPAVFGMKTPTAEVGA